MDVTDTFDWGQGSDEVCLELIENFKKFYDGYYGLINYGDDWIENFNQTIDPTQLALKEWKQIDANNFMGHLENLKSLLIGMTTGFDRWSDGILSEKDNINSRGFNRRISSDE